jgi:hypothetical protein
VFEESCLGNTMGDLNTLLDLDFTGKDKIVRVYSKELYDEVEGFIDRHEVRVDTKYKTVAKKVRPVALPLPADCEENVKRASIQPNPRDPKMVGHEFTDMELDWLRVEFEDYVMEIEARCFKEMLIYHGEAFAFESHEIGCVDLGVVTPMIIFTVPHIPWNLHPIPIPRAHLPQLKRSRWEYRSILLHHILLYLDSILCTCGRSIVLLVEKGAKISMDEGAK